MPLSFSSVCKLFDEFEYIATRHPPLPRTRDHELRTKIEYWFRCHRRDIDMRSVDGVALLSTFFPERRTDRIYGMQEARLEKLIARCLHLNKASIRLLGEWRAQGRGDLGECVHKVLKPFDCETKPGATITIEEVDSTLNALASRSQFSSPALRSSGQPGESAELLVDSILKRLSSVEAKWFTRILLKDFSILHLDERTILSQYHFLLPDLLRFQDSFGAATGLLNSELRHYPSSPSIELQRAARAEASRLLSPAIGVKVGRQVYHKARSLQNCVDMCGSQMWSAERKYDGEFCEIHIDLSKGEECIQIFSKSKKDSTADRAKAHPTIRSSLRLGDSSCAFRRKAILTGELVVWSDQQRKILDFYHIRKHVTRSGKPLGCNQDSQIKEGERLMIIYFDLLLLDDELVLRRPYNERRERLRNVIRSIPGYAMTAERTLIDFSRPKEARQKLCYQFAAALASRCEGLVLKPVSMPYFRFYSDGGGADKAYLIKLKKDYLQELGGLRDVADFTVIGASYDPKLVHKSSIRNLSFTSYYLGCCVNKEAAVRFGVKPEFRIMAAISLDQCIPPRELQALDNYAKFHSEPVQRNSDGSCSSASFRIVSSETISVQSLTHILTDPCVVEVLGSAYERPSNTSYQMLRHPRILRLHTDRCWQDACSYSELQELAAAANRDPVDSESREMSQIVKKFEGKFRRKFGDSSSSDAAMTPTQATRSTVSPQMRKTVVSVPTLPSSSPNPRRRPATKGHSPVLVRIDTGERRPGDPELAAASESLPTPPTSSEISSDDAGAKRKRSTFIRDDEVLSKRICVQQQTDVMVSTPLFSRDLNTLQSPGPVPATSKTMRTDVVRVQSPASRTGLDLTAILSCSNPRCPLSMSVIHLSPCISGFQWVNDTLLSWHGAVRAADLRSWVRETSQSASGTKVAESAAYPDRQKLALVESNRIEATMDYVNTVKELGVRELVLFYDWRILEDWKLAEGENSQEFLTLDPAGYFQKRYFGFTFWSEEQGKVVFMHKNMTRMPKRWLTE